MNEKLAILFEYGMWRVVSISEDGSYMNIVGNPNSFEEAMQQIASAYSANSNGRVLFSVAARQAP